MLGIIGMDRVQVDRSSVVEYGLSPESANFVRSLFSSCRRLRRTEQQLGISGRADRESFIVCLRRICNFESDALDVDGF